MQNSSFWFFSLLAIVFSVSASAADIPEPVDERMRGKTLAETMVYWDREPLLEVFQEVRDKALDKENIVLFAKMQFRILTGEADLERTQALIDRVQPGLRVKQNADGNAVVKVQAFRAQYVVGCACPPAFSDLLVTVAVEAPAGFADKGKTHVVPIFNITTHEERKASFHVKFGSPTRVGTVGFVTDTGFVALDKFAQRQVFAAAAESLPWPDSGREITVDTGVHTIGGLFDNRDGTSWEITPRFYRKHGKVYAASRPFRETAGDRFALTPGSDLDRLIGGAGGIAFKPLTWTRAELVPGVNARVWLPR